MYLYCANFLDYMPIIHGMWIRIEGNDNFKLL